MSVSMTSVSLPKPFRNTITLATRHEDTPEGVYEIALDECGRGPMFGRLYAAAVVLPLGQDRGEAYTSFLRGSEATSRLEPTTSVLDPASSPKGTGLPLRSPPPLWSSSVIASCMEAKYPNGIAGRPPTQTLSVNTTEVFASTSSIPKTCFQSMSECCSRWYRTQSSPDHS